jgi:hypothetical protein
VVLGEARDKIDLRSNRAGLGLEIGDVFGLVWEIGVVDGRT